MTEMQPQFDLESATIAPHFSARPL